jgi:S-adenosylmethionine synthetase
VLDAIYTNDPYGRVACETATTTGLVVVLGEITTETYVEMQDVVRETIRNVGYTRAKYGFDCDTCGVIVSIKQQSGDIAQGVNRSVEGRSGEFADDMAIGAGDQGMMMGFACNETPELMPMPILLAHKVCRQLAAVRKDGSLPYLRPDGKSQISVEYSYGRPVRIDTVVVSTQHDENTTQEQIARDVIEQVVRRSIPVELLDDRTKYYINPTGRFVTGGPMGDA